MVILEKSSEYNQLSLVLFSFWYIKITACKVKNQTLSFTHFLLVLDIEILRSSFWALREMQFWTPTSNWDPVESVRPWHRVSWQTYLLYKDNSFTYIYKQSSHRLCVYLDTILVPRLGVRVVCFDMPSLYVCINVRLII